MWVEDKAREEAMIDDKWNKRCKAIFTPSPEMEPQSVQQE